MVLDQLGPQVLERFELAVLQQRHVLQKNFDAQIVLLLVGNLERCHTFQSVSIEVLQLVEKHRVNVVEVAENVLQQLVVVDDGLVMQETAFVDDVVVLLLVKRVRVMLVLLHALETAFLLVYYKTHVAERKRHILSQK